jgi:predicted house-cleaning noncanonical NTP pyrophosphatase (MazG superfamily)
MQSENTPSAPIATPAAAVGKVKKKQYLTEVSASHKGEIDSLVESLSLKNAREAFEVIHAVATAFRFNSEGDDLWEAESKRIALQRDGRKELESTIAGLESLAAKLGLSSEELEAMKAKAFAKLGLVPDPVEIPVEEVEIEGEDGAA